MVNSQRNHWHGDGFGFLVRGTSHNVFSVNDNATRVTSVDDLITGGTIAVVAIAAFQVSGLLGTADRNSVDLKILGSNIIGTRLDLRLCGALKGGAPGPLFAVGKDNELTFLARHATAGGLPNEFAEACRGAQGGQNNTVTVRGDLTAWEAANDDLSLVPCRSGF